MSSGDTRALIAQAVERFLAEVPSLKPLKLVARLELRARGGTRPSGASRCRARRSRRTRPAMPGSTCRLPVRTSTSWRRRVA